MSMDMGVVDLFLHALNFMLPAACVACLVTLSGQLFKKNRPVVDGLNSRIAINFVVCMGVLVAGLIITGRDGKMLTYLAMVLASATAQWILSGGWRK
jgi:hypothetical protein